MQLATYKSSKASADVSAPVMYIPIYPVSAIGEAAGLSSNPAMEFEERNRRQISHAGS